MVITVLGGGNGGHAAAADMALKGHNVRLYEDPRFAGRIKIVFDTKKIKYSGALGEGSAGLEMVTSDIAQAVKGADFVIIAAPAFAHSGYAELLADNLEDGQAVFFLAGAMGSLILKETMKRKGIRRNIILAETHTLPYKTRLIEPGHALVMGFNLPLLAGVLPASKTDEILEKFKGLYTFTKAQSVAECALSSLNPIVHVPTCLLNSGRIELAKGNFRFYSEGITPCVGGVIEALDKERSAIERALGYDPLPINAMIAPQGVSPSLSVYEIFTLDKEVAEIKGPVGLQDRYFTEDIR